MASLMNTDRRLARLSRLEDREADKAARAFAQECAARVDGYLDLLRALGYSEEAVAMKVAAFPRAPLARARVAYETLIQALREQGQQA